MLDYEACGIARDEAVIERLLGADIDEEVSFTLKAELRLTFKLIRIELGEKVPF